MSREIVSMDKDWKFHYGDILSVRNRWAWGKSGSWNQGPESRSFDDSDWQDVELPHDFIIATEPKAYMEQEFGKDNVIPLMENVNNIHTTAGSFQKEVGWYRKHFYIPKEDEGRKLYLVFEGIYRDSSAYLNEFYIGGERSGYSRIVYDITDFANYGGDNLLSIKVDARQAEGWFYEGGGIYRHAYLLKTEQAHLDNTFVHCDVNLEENSADVYAQVELDTEWVEKVRLLAAQQEQAKKCVGHDISMKNVSIKVDIFSPEGQLLATKEMSAIDMDASNNTITTVFHLEQVQLWDTEHPSLYRAETTLLVADAEVDKDSVRFGIRDIYFDADKGFFLNGVPTKIKGVCCHQNHGGVGAAMPDELYRFRIRKLKEMGVNGYRVSHYPPSPVLLDICDEEGMLVMDETRLLSSEKGDLAQLTTLVKRDRNHPSVILYSIGNEEAQSQTTRQGARIAGTMLREIKKLDPYTPVTMALLMWDLKNKKPITDIEEIAGISEQLDVAGFNYHHHRWPAHHAAYPNQPMICTEQGTFKSTRGCYETNGSACHLSIMDKTADSYMKGVEQWKACLPDWMSGLFLWTGFDYYGEPTPYAWPAISSQFGAMDLCGFPKDFYYYYKAWWSKEDVLHIFPHWTLMEGTVTDIYVLSNCDEVELFVNGVSIGRKTMEQDGYLVWEQVTYEPGELLGVGYRNGQEILRESKQTVGAAHAVKLTEEYRENTLCVIKAEIVDEQGQVVPDAKDEIVFEVSGGKVLGTSNGNPSDHAAPNGNVRKAFHGLAQAIIRLDECGEENAAENMTEGETNTQPSGEQRAVAQVKAIAQAIKNDTMIL